jgi:hypothetical protein
VTTLCKPSSGAPKKEAHLAKTAELMTFSLIATDDAGAFVFAWHKDADMPSSEPDPNSKTIQSLSRPHHRRCGTGI